MKGTEEIEQRVRIVLISLVGLMGLVGCSSELDEAMKETASRNPVPIAFECWSGTYETDETGETSTRAANGYTGNLTTENHQLRYTGFGVFACQQAGNTPDLMYNQKVEFTFYADNTSEGYWTYSPIKYWPNKSEGEPQTVCFYAYAPYVPQPESLPADATGITGMSANNETTPYLIYTRAKHPEENVDLLWSAYTPTTIKPICFDVEKDEDDNIIADRCLHHALARVRLSLGITNGSTLASGDKLLVQRITLKGNFAKTGKLNLNQGPTGAPPVWVPNWTEQVLADPELPADDDHSTIFIDCNPEVNADSYGIIDEKARYHNDLPSRWQPAGLPHKNYDAADASTKTNLLCMGDALSYLYLIPQTALSFTCVLDYCIISADGTKTDYQRPEDGPYTINLGSVVGNKTYDVTLKITL